MGSFGNFFIPTQRREGAESVRAPFFIRADGSRKAGWRWILCPAIMQPIYLTLEANKGSDELKMIMD
jgi:hypothetical protein